MIAQCSNISFRASDKIIYTQDAVSFIQQTAAKMGANKTCSTGNNDFQRIGPPSTEEVYSLRILRDEILLKYTFGKNFVQFYYNFSPPIAEYIKLHNTIKFTMKCILYPIISISNFFLYYRRNTKDDRY